MHDFFKTIVLSSQIKLNKFVFITYKGINLYIKTNIKYKLGPSNLFGKLTQIHKNRPYDFNQNRNLKNNKLQKLRVNLKCRLSNCP